MEVASPIKLLGLLRGDKTTSAATHRRGLDGAVRGYRHVYKRQKTTKSFIG